jgi:FecR-like protein
MLINKRKAGVIVSFFLLFLFFATALEAKTLLPAGLVITETFRPGIGAPVGRVQLVQGDVIIIHAGEREGFRAKKNLSIFKKDTLITLKKGRIRFALNDGSILTLASETKIEINDSVFAPRKKSRFSFLSMAWGKARFWVKKAIDLKRSEFKVRSRTAVVGVRGSDFVVRATPLMTRVIAFEDTRLELVSLARPDVPPILLRDFERVHVRIGEIPSDVERLSPAEINRIKREFAFFPKISPAAPKIIGKKKRPGAKSLGPDVEEADGILVPEEELVDPDLLVDMEVLEEPELLEIIETDEIIRLEERILEHQQDISENIIEDVIEEIFLEEQELPSLPGTPN